MRRNCNGIYSALEQIRKRLSEETTYTEGVSEVPEGEDPSFEANQVASGYSLSWDLEIGRILDYEWMHRKFARADQQKKVRIYTHLYRRNAEIAGLSRNIYEPWMENR